MPLGRDQILTANDLEVREVHVPEWADAATGDDIVLVKALTGEERQAFQLSLVQFRPLPNGQQETRPNLGNMAAKLVARAVVDEQGNRVFKDQDVAALGRKSGAALERVFEVAQEMSGLSDQDIEAAVENFSEMASDDSVSSSPEISDAPSENSYAASPAAN